jgi:hypothetical protein
MDQKASSLEQVIQSKNTQRQHLTEEINELLMNRNSIV